MLQPVTKDDKSNRTRKSIAKQQPPIKKNKVRKNSIYSQSLDLSSGKLPTSPHSSCGKPCIFNDYIAGQAAHQKQKKTKPILDGKSSYADQMSISNSRNASRNSMITPRSNKSNGSYRMAKTDRDDTQKSQSSQKNQYRLSQVLKLDKNQGIAPYQSKMKTKKVMKTIGVRESKDLDRTNRTQKCTSPSKKSISPSKKSVSPTKKNKSAAKDKSGSKSPSKKKNTKERNNLSPELDKKINHILSKSQEQGGAYTAAAGVQGRFNQLQAVQLNSDLDSVIPVLGHNDEQLEMQLMQQNSSPYGSPRRLIQADGQQPYTPYYNSPQSEADAKLNSNISPQKKSRPKSKNNTPNRSFANQNDEEPQRVRQQISNCTPNKDTLIANNNCEPEPDPTISETPIVEQSPIVKESQEYVYVEAYALAKCAQRVLKSLATTVEDERKDAIDQMVNKVNIAIEKLQFYQQKVQKIDAKAVQAIYVCESILLIEKYKLEQSSFDLQNKLKQLLHILKHLSIKELEQIQILQDKIFQEKQALLFDRVYTNHLYVLLCNNATMFEVEKIEKVFKIIEFLITSRSGDEDDGFKSTIKIQDDLKQVLENNKQSEQAND